MDRGIKIVNHEIGHLFGLRHWYVMQVELSPTMGVEIMLIFVYNVFGLVDRSLEAFTTTAL